MENNRGFVNELFGKNFEINELDWDTNYFGVRSAKVVLKDCVIEGEREDIIEHLKPFDFVTILNNGNNSSNNIWLGRETNAFLTDVNIQFTKALKEKPVCVSDIAKVYQGYHRDEELLEIARNTFEYSRFFNDPYLPSDKSKNIYVHWAASAFDNPKRFFTIIKVNEKTVGFILFSMRFEDLSATVELIAVNSEYKGQHIGKTLISCFESYVFDNGIRMIKVGTQSDNMLAAGFYTSCGFKYSKSSTVYHYWPKK
ncbi:GNAT family N-acetyltransferase [Paenibacillus doosanensis]|uniref:GNAT family N-acetyltransferase n=1 Tax=Paenibacillus doosanensis TaxID=1229154 RepID=UPI00217FCA5C|nr:GNAT family N-acetyltransferase [Paenibacillus doosanensis]MCS7459897.1 GNAT family N-acetyltransferase [Paenibacillus doosanensis]